MHFWSAPTLFLDFACIMPKIFRIGKNRWQYIKFYQNPRYVTKRCNKPISRSLTDITEWGRTTPHLNIIISTVVAKSVQRMAEKLFGQHRSKRACVMPEWHHPCKPMLSLFRLLICWFWFVFDDFYMVLVHMTEKSDENHRMWNV